MKLRCIALVLWIFASITMIGYSQTLQFSRVLLVNSAQTVPNGAVWKVEHVMPTSMTRYSGSFYSTGSPNEFVVAINGTNTSYGHSSLINNYGQTTAEIPGVLTAGGPTWLPSGTTIQPIANVAYISIIEFTIIP